MKLNKLINAVLPISMAVCSVVYSVQLQAVEHDTGHHSAQNSTGQYEVRGMSVGDVRADSAVIWSRTDRESIMHVHLKGKAEHNARHETIKVTAKRDFTGKLRLENLQPATDYEYRIWFSAEEQDRKIPHTAMSGHFTTAPRAEKSASVSFVWGGDLAGQNVCRDIDEGFPVFNAINDMQPEFFIGLGDMIYADGTCSETGRYANSQIPGEFTQSADMENYWAHWKYNQADAGLQTLLANMPYYAIWDDHEVVNDFGPLHDTRSSAPYTEGVHLLPKGLQAFLDYNPVDESPDQPKRLYRTIRWGKHFELFVLDTRQYRDANSSNDDSIIKKTLLGREQLTWLKAKLKSSDATWKMIVSSVPLSIPTGYPAENGRDGWANYDQQGGFEQELMELLSFMRDEGINKSIWLTTDVHFASVFRYTPFSDSPDFQLYEYVTGPLNAGLFPNRKYDTSLGTERLFFYGPSENVTSFEQARTWMNYGAVRIEKDGMLNISIHNVDGKELYKQQLYPERAE